MAVLFSQTKSVWAERVFTALRRKAIGLNRAPGMFSLVIPAQAGIQCLLGALPLDSRLRGNDEIWAVWLVMLVF